MGTAPKRLVILVTDPAIMEWPEIQKLIAQKHTVGVLPSSAPPVDLVLGPNAQIMDESRRPWFKDAIALARKRKYPKEEPEPEEES